MSRGKKKNPLEAKRSEGGMVAIWMTQNVWWVIRDGAVRQYLWHRECVGGEKARKEMNAREVGDGWGFAESSARESLSIYTFGYETWVKPDEKQDRFCAPITPEKLVALGDRKELEAYEEQLKRLRDKAGKAVAA